MAQALAALDGVKSVDPVDVSGSQVYAYDGAFYEGVTKWIDTSEAKIMFIYGNSDPWYSLRMHDTDNPNVKMFVSDTKPHTVRMMDFDEATMQEMGAFISEAIPVQ